MRHVLHAVCSLVLAASITQATIAQAPASRSIDEIRQREAEPLYQAALRLAQAADDLSTPEAQKAVLDQLEAAIKAGACPTRALIEDSFVQLHTVQRYRELMREYSWQWDTNMRLNSAPGQPLRVTGIVRDASGKPVAGALVYVYHADANGLYNPAGTNEANPRLFGYMITNAEGRYAFSTIRPGHYPDQNEPVEQHVHYEVTAKGYKCLKTRLGFADDPFWNDRRIPTWAVAVTKDARGVDECQYDLVLKAAE